MSLAKGNFNSRKLSRYRSYGKSKSLTLGLSPINLINQSGNFELDRLLSYDMLDWLGLQYRLSLLD
jgi:hypothetical protein